MYIVGHHDKTDSILVSLEVPASASAIGIGKRAICGSPALAAGVTAWG